MGGTCAGRGLGAFQKWVGLEWSVDWGGKTEKVYPRRSFTIYSRGGTEGRSWGGESGK